MGNFTIKSDIIISIRQPHLNNIVSQTKTHEFRGYLLPETVKRFWIYETSPVSAIKYIAEVGIGKPPGSHIDNGSVKDDDCQQGIIVNGKYAYEILRLEALDELITLSELKAKGWLGGAPQKYCYMKQLMADAVADVKTTNVFVRPASKDEAMAEKTDIPSTRLKPLSACC